MNADNTQQQLLCKALAPASIIATTTGWNFLATGQVSVSVLFFFTALTFTCIATGDLLVALVHGTSSRFNGLSLRLLTGFLAINTLLYFLVLILPLGISYSAILIVITVFLIRWWIRKPLAKVLIPASSPVELVFLLLSLVAASFWCQDLFNPILAGQTETTIRAWPDVFFHIRQISLFASTDTAVPLSDFQMAGAPSHAYHYASYMLPAALVAMTPTTSLYAYGGTFVPFGLLLTALASFSLLSSLMGRWPGAAAGLALLLAPDALQQGFGNGFLSYHWLQHVGPASLYGVAIAALAWLLMFEACKERKLYLIPTAYFVGLCIAIFKAQIFVANAYLIFIFPAFFMKGFVTNTRRIYFYVATTLFLLAIFVSQQSKNIPVIRLDGTGIDSYGASLLSAQNQGAFYSFVTYTFQSSTGLIFILSTAVVLLFGTFGIWAAAYPLLIARIKQKLRLSIVIFPLLVAINYLLMSQGLALDSNGVGRPEELLNRPFVWAYFVICSWGGAMLYFLFFGNRKPLRKFSALAIFIVMIAGLAVPFQFGHNIHSLQQWLPNVDGVKLPTCLVQSAEYVRKKSDVGALIQDSSNDANFAFTALAERQEFAINAGGVRAPSGVFYRLAQLNHKLKKFESEKEVLAFVRANSIAWYLRRPEDTLRWPKSVDNYIEYQCGNYRLYNFKLERAISDPSTNISRYQ